MHTFIYTYVEIIVWWQLQNYVTNVNQWLSTCYSALLNSYFWSFKHEMWDFAFPKAMNVRQFIKNHLKAFFYYLSEIRFIYFFFPVGYFWLQTPRASTSWDMLRLWRTVQLAVTLDTLDLYLWIWLDYTVTKLVFLIMTWATVSSNISRAETEIIIYDISLREHIFSWVTCIITHKLLIL